MMDSFPVVMENRIRGEHPMTEFDEIREACEDLSTEGLLRYLIKDRFPGMTVVTASLRAPSIVVLKMIADIDPGTPVMFCRPGQLFEESEAHRDNWLKCVRSRELPNADIEIGHLSALHAHLGNLGVRLGGRRLVFDGATESIVGDDEANALLTGAYREPFVVPKEV